MILKMDSVSHVERTDADECLQAIYVIARPPWDTGQSNLTVDLQSLPIFLAKFRLVSPS